MEEIIGMGSEPTNLALSAASKKYFIPYANQPVYKAALESIAKKEKPDQIHLQNDLDIYYASLLCNEIEGLAEKVFMLTHE